MNNIRKQIWKVAKWGSLIILLVVFVIYIWIRGIYKEAYSASEFENHITEVSAHPDLPNNFNAILEKVHPTIFKNSFNTHIINILVFRRNPELCPCRWLAGRSDMRFKVQSRIKNVLLIPSLAWAYESHLSQKQCLNAIMSDYDFTNGIIGITDASRKHYDKELEDLDLEEQLELIVMMQNSVLYDKDRRPELLNKRVEELKKKINEGL